MSKKGSGSCSGKSGVFGGKYKKILKLIIIEDDLKIKEVPEGSILRHLLNKDTLKFIKKLEDNHGLRSDEDKRNDVFLANNVDKTAEITDVEFYKNKMGPIPDVGGKVHHKFIVFKTNSGNGVFWWSIEKNTKYFVMQRSSVKEKVINEIEVKPRDPVEKTEDEEQRGNGTIYELLKIALVYGIIGEKYHLLKSTCQHLVEFLSKIITADKYKSRGAIPYSTPPAANGIFPDHFDPQILSRNFEFSKWDPIDALIYMDKPELLEKAVQKKVYDINDIYRGVTLLNFAIGFSRIKTVKYLLNEMKADPTKSDKRGRTPIQMAAYYNRKGPEIIKLLLKTNQVHITDQDEARGNTALHFAVYATNVKSVRYLLDKGADPKISDDLGRTSLDIATMFEKDVELIDVLLSTRKVSVDDLNEKTGYTALHCAAVKSNALTARHMLKKGADPNSINKNKRTALHTAAIVAENTEIIDVLLNIGKLDINARDIDGKTPLD